MSRAGRFAGVGPLGSLVCGLFGPASLLASAAGCSGDNFGSPIADGGDTDASGDVAQKSADAGNVVPVYVALDAGAVAVHPAEAAAVSSTDGGDEGDVAPDDAYVDGGDAGDSADVAEPLDATSADEAASCASGSLACGGACVPSDVHNCGACGNACTAPYGATASCTAGDGGSNATCGWSCNAGLSSCNGACVNLQSDAANCGACGTACSTALSHAAASCSGGACNVACSAGFHMCGSGASAACADDTSVGSCGASCTPCTAPANASANCTATSGAYACGWSCDSQFTMCGSECTDNANDAQNCGSCGHSCAPGTCSGSTCQPWIIAQPPATSQPTSVASDGTYVAWFDAGQQKCWVTRAAGAAGGFAPSVFGSGDTGGSSPTGRVSLTNGLAACIVPMKSGNNSLWTTVALSPSQSSSPGFTLGAGAPTTPAGLALNSNAGSAYMILDDGNAAAVVYRCLLGSSTSCSSITSFTYSSTPTNVPPGNLIDGGLSLFWAEGPDGVVSSLPFGASSIQHVATGQGNVSQVTADTAYVYWASSSVNGTFTLERASQTGSSPVTPLLSTSFGVVHALATDGASLLYMGGTYSVGGQPNDNVGFIGYVPVTASGAQSLYPVWTGSLNDLVYDMVYSAGVLYFTNLATNTVYGLRFP